LARGWTKEDYEIFDLVSAVETSEGKGTTFYSWLDVSPTASPSEISKAYRKKSVQLHPDKNPGVKGAHERFAQLGVIAQILRNGESRERYDFFYKNGVPKWRGTGYYYSRYRPGLLSVIIFLIFLTSGLQYLVHKMNYKSDLARVEKIVNDARQAAWGPLMRPQPGKKKVKVPLTNRSAVDEDGNVVPGRTIDMVVEGEEVFILEPNGALLPLDAGAASPPALTRTWFVSLLVSLYDRVVSGQKKPEAGEILENSDSDVPSVDGTGDSDGKAAATDGSSNGRARVSKVGGRRRKR